MIQAHCYISSKGLRLNGEWLTSTENDDLWLKTLYKELNIEYPKFYKMDDLSKMAFIGVEHLQSFFPNDLDLSDNLALVFANRSSSQQTDLKFEYSYEEGGAPSPSLFVYTLPNILTGELCIRHKWYGDNIFFITEDFNAELYNDQINFAYQNGHKLVLCGWVEADKAGNHECLLFLAAQSQINDYTKTIKELINTYRHE